MLAGGAGTAERHGPRRTKAVAPSGNTCCQALMALGMTRNNFQAPDAARSTVCLMIDVIQTFSVI